MASPDLSKLSIDRTAAGAPRVRRRLWPWAVGLALLAAAAILGVSGGLGGPVTVETASVTTAYPSQAVTALNATGYVVAQRKAAVASKATGRLEWLGVMEGSRVRKDEVIARLESRDVAAAREQAAANVQVATANLEQAQAELRDADRNLARWRELSRDKLISELELDTAVARADKARAAMRSSEAAVAVARANLRAADVSFDQTLIRAPFDGVVLTKNANVGDNITPFSSAVDTRGAVVTIADMSTLEVEADVAESSLGRIKVGQPCEIQLDAVPDTRFAGVVNRIVPTVDRAKATVMVKIGFIDRDQRVLPDMSAKVAFLEREVAETDRKPVTAVPRQAVVERDGAKVVFVVKEGRAVRTRIETGRALGDLIEVRGIQTGEKIVLTPLDRVADGTRVKTDRK
ncbi:hemolysin secretion protein D [Candidatus Methylomirabilis lanthanidiphila]|uniref:Hemolysin secretion protein D n=1 Tax=Candidatus Methylomirabilis lanthanidiphila TaxID=2211376 RepID=A0A564ZK94_9BACT|nr:efflux RND transporter periplasmic adaptor subunit [Candidatus Methylomirabilis lanthanidiphila]VUZ85603.1 hemolysin secretion protein D [Candidatus Methylomirabilis lanthanidiphila]